MGLAEVARPPHGAEILPPWPPSPPCPAPCAPWRRQGPNRRRSCNCGGGSRRRRCSCRRRQAADPVTRAVRGDDVDGGGGVHLSPPLATPSPTPPGAGCTRTRARFRRSRITCGRSCTAHILLSRPCGGTSVYLSRQPWALALPRWNARVERSWCGTPSAMEGMGVNCGPPEVGMVGGGGRRVRPHRRPRAGARRARGA